jgi:hypothetical protein
MCLAMRAVRVALPIVLLSSCSDPDSEAKRIPEDGGESGIKSGGVTSVALSGPSGNGEAVMRFTRVKAEVTGLDFTNAIEPNHPLKHLYATEKVCGGVAAGDVDGNGMPDLFFTSGPNKNRLFLQTSNLKFGDHTALAGVDGGGVWSAGAAMIDIEGDGDLDIYVANYAAPNQLFINRGDATFDEKAGAYGLAHLSASHMPTFCDYDRDGDLDLYLLTNRFHSPNGQPKSEDVLQFKVEDGVGKISFSDPALGNYFRPYQAEVRPDGRPVFKLKKYGQVDVLFRNEGGKFSDVSAQAGIVGNGFGLSATWWDYNQDGWPDLWVGNDFDDPDRIYRNNQDGTFTDVVKEVTPHTSWFSMGADFADLNGDNHPDFLIADMSGTSHFKQKTNMGSMGSNAEFLRTADPQQYMRNALFLGTGGERLLEAAHMTGLANSDWTWTVKLSDLDCDGRPDVFMTNGMSKNFNESDNAAVIPMAGETEWDRHVRSGTKELREQNLAFRNLGDLKFEDVSKEWGLDHVGMSFGTAHADLDRDGDLDMIVCNLDEPVSLYRNDSKEGNRLLIRLQGAGGNRFGIGAKVQLELADGSVQSRQLIPVRGYLASSEPLVHFGLGDGEPRRLIIDWPGGHHQVVNEVDANRFYTISEPEGVASPKESETEKPETLFAETDVLKGATHKENEFDDFSKQPLLPNQMSRLGPGQAWGDIDSDGDDDFWLGGAAGSPGRIWINEGNGDFKVQVPAALQDDAGYEDMGALWFDADGNGFNDLYVVSGGYEFELDDPELADRLYLNDGSSLSRAPDGMIPKARVSGGVVVGADYDRDGDLDLFVGGRQIPGAYPEAAKSSLLVNEGGKFSDAGLEVMGLITSALWSDVNGDGWVDLLLTEEWGPIRVLQNEEGQLRDVTETSGTSALTGWWNGIAGGDFDGDGDIDYVATNFGLNTKYHASSEHPALLYYGDFENLGRKRIVEAEFENDVLYPGRGRSCSSNAMPHLRKTFTSFKQYAGSALTDIYKPEKLQGSMKLAATVFETGIFVNETPSGGAPKFVFKPLPRIAQIAPSFGVVVSDVNQDGVADIYLAQNFHSPQVETGRMSGGLSQLLLGIGDGTFEAVAVERSGLLAPGDAASLTQADVNADGVLDFVVARNDGPVSVFKSTQKGGTNLAVRLRGAKGNASAIGARVSLQFESGKKATGEFYAGGGYLSQSSAMIYFGVPVGDSAATLNVVWPDGNQSEHLLTGASGAVTIRPGN